MVSVSWYTRMVEENRKQIPVYFFSQRMILFILNSENICKQALQILLFSGYTQ